MKLKLLLLSLALAAPAVGDTITMKSGDTIRGTVRQFHHNHHSTASSAFVVDVDGDEQTIPLHKIETITFASRQQQATAVGGTPSRSPSRQPVANPEKSEAEDGSYWLTTSSGKRHNEKCRYYKTSKGRPCSRDEGTPCKACGG